MWEPIVPWLGAVGNAESLPQKVPATNQSDFIKVHLGNQWIYWTYLQSLGKWFLTSQKQLHWEGQKNWCDQIWERVLPACLPAFTSCWLGVYIPVRCCRPLLIPDTSFFGLPSKEGLLISHFWKCFHRPTQAGACPFFVPRSCQTDNQKFTITISKIILYNLPMGHIYLYYRQIGTDV